MKAPKYFIQTPQDAHNCRINPFALTLLAESFADDPERFGTENILLMAHAHNGKSVWFVMTITQPTSADFDPPETGLAGTDNSESPDSKKEGEGQN